jgi:DHA2 family multidrug resistance protein
MEDCGLAGAFGSSYVLTKGFDPRKLIFVGLALIAASLWWMGSMNLQAAEIDMILPRIVQVLGVGLTTVPISTIMFRFLPKEQSSQAAGIYALVRNEGGSIGIAMSSTWLQRKAQVYNQVLSQHTVASSAWVQQFIAGLASHPGNPADNHYAAMARLYGAMQQQANLLSYMDQVRGLGGAAAHPVLEKATGAEAC